MITLKAGVGLGDSDGDGDGLGEGEGDTDGLGDGDGFGEGEGLGLGDGDGLGDTEGDGLGDPPGVGGLLRFCGSLGVSNAKSLKLLPVSCVLPLLPIVEPGTPIGPYMLRQKMLPTIAQQIHPSTIAAITLTAV